MYRNRKACFLWFGMYHLNCNPKYARIYIYVCVSLHGHMLTRYISKCNKLWNDNQYTLVKMSCSFTLILFTLATDPVVAVRIYIAPVLHCIVSFHPYIVAVTFVFYVTGLCHLAPLPLLVEEWRTYLLSKWFGKQGRWKTVFFSSSVGWGGFAPFNGLHGETPS